MIELKVHIVPGSSKDQIVGFHGDRLKIKLKAPPVDGKANDALIAFLSQHFQIKKSDIQILRGHTSRQKDLAIQNISQEDLLNF